MRTRTLVAAASRAEREEQQRDPPLNDQPVHDALLEPIPHLAYLLTSGALPHC
jgi:hypothetical protein